MPTTVESLDTIVNPKKQKIELVNSMIDPSGYEWISDLIGARMFTFVRLYDNGDGVYIDDEGLYADQRFFWIHKNYPQPLVNKGLFMGTDNEGNSIPPQTSLTQFQKDVKFIGDTHDLQVMMMFNKAKISMENGYEDYRPMFFK